MDEDKIKVSGYLEKKGKMKMMNSYKKYWFVLEGRLLLYYRSKDEYETLSPCKGSINLGPPCNIKPCSSTHGVFQIETRASTITLRAENQEDQNRWMHGIMSALNQNQNSAKLSHFRYSLYELQQDQIVKENLKQSNSNPSSANPSQNEPNKGIIQRLQKMGAQRYGGSMETINQIVTSKKNELASSNESLQSPTSMISFRNSILIENDQYRTPKKNIIAEHVDIRTGNKDFENVYERISRGSTTLTKNSEDIICHSPNIKTEHEKNILSKTAVSCESNLSKKTYDAETPDKTSVHLENEDCDASRAIKLSQNKNIRGRRDSTSEAVVERPSTFLLENEVYATSKAVAAQNNKNNLGRENSLMLENRYYHSADKIKFTGNSSENIYQEPKCTKLTDHNENNVVLNNSQHTTNGEENAYSVTKLYEPDKDIVTTNSTSEYEDIEYAVEYSELKHQDNEICNQHSQNKSKSILKKSKKKKLKKGKTDENEKEVKLKKTPSFIKRVWRKKPKRKETDDNSDNLYETVPAAVVEKVCINDDTAIQMLSELHTILENKKPILTERLILETNCSKKIDEKLQDEKVSSRDVNSSASSDETAVQMLTELQNILENKKNLLTARMSIDKGEHKVGTEKSEKNVAQYEAQKNPNDVEVGSTSSTSEKMRPLLPPKTQKTNMDSPYHDFPRNNQPINKVLPPKKKRNFENVKSLDEILDDLEREESDSNKNKVKKLIKQFSDSDFNEKDVVLRTNRRTENFSREDVDSDELSRLLNELAKVTCAPILTPGVTTSLINPNLTDEELLNLIPKRRRRYSEPDYDIPRPHKSLTNLPKKETPADSVIGSTRFFGPILKPSDIDIKTTNVKISSEDIPSMTPDSLEVDVQAICPHLSYSSEDEKTFSYTSHNYVKNKNSFGVRSKEDHIKYKNIPTNIENSIKLFDHIIIKNDIYAQPKSLRNITTLQEHQINNTHKNLLLKNNKRLDDDFDVTNMQEVFADSLET